MRERIKISNPAIIVLELHVIARPKGRENLQNKRHLLRAKGNQLSSVFSQFSILLILHLFGLNS